MSVKILTSSIISNYIFIPSLILYMRQPHMTTNSLLAVISFVYMCVFIYSYLYLYILRINRALMKVIGTQQY